MSQLKAINVLKTRRSPTRFHAREREALHAGLQIEAGLDRASTGSSFIRDMTVLVLDPTAQGLEPRIVRSILERIEQARPVTLNCDACFCQLGCACATACMCLCFSPASHAVRRSTYAGSIFWAY